MLAFLAILSSSVILWRDLRTSEGRNVWLHPSHPTGSSPYRCIYKTAWGWVEPHSRAHCLRPSIELVSSRYQHPEDDHGLQRSWPGKTIFIYIFIVIFMILIHRDLNKMADILQTTFSNACYLHIFVSFLTSHRSLFPRNTLINSHHWFR